MRSQRKQRIRSWYKRQLRKLWSNKELVQKFSSVKETPYMSRGSKIQDPEGTLITKTGKSSKLRIQKGDGKEDMGHLGAEKKYCRKFLFSQLIPPSGKQKSSSRISRISRNWQVKQLGASLRTRLYHTLLFNSQGVPCLLYRQCSVNAYGISDTNPGLLDVRVYLAQHCIIHSPRDYAFHSSVPVC